MQLQQGVEVFRGVADIDVRHDGAGDPVVTTSLKDY